MKWEEWLDLPTIKALSQHASATLAAFLCFIVVGVAVKYAPLSEAVRAILEVIEQSVLIGLVIWFVWQTALVLWKGRIGNAPTNSFVVA
jgi:hypothetical protein